MITVFGIGGVPQSVNGMTRNLRVEWAFEDIGNSISIPRSIPSNFITELTAQSF